MILNKGEKDMQEFFPCYVCGKSDYRIIASIDEKPKGETDYHIPAEQYYREICQCNHCAVFFNKHDLIPEDFYQGQYNAAITLGNLQERYQKIMSLPEDKSDNKLRVQRIIQFLKEKQKQPHQVSALDVGSGTGVFPGELQKQGVQASCVDPDSQAVQLAREHIRVYEAFEGSLRDVPKEKKYDLITYNKVLEHVKAPVELLKEAGDYLQKGGIVYVELPWGTPSVEVGKEKERQEFFLEHHTIFNQDSFRYLVRQAGFALLALETLTEPSGKFTIYGFMQKE